LFGGRSVRVVEGGGAFEDYGDSIIPAPVFSRMVAGFFDLDAQDAPALDLFFQDRQVVLLEKLDELVRLAPFLLVLILPDVWLILPRLLGERLRRRDEPGGQRQCDRR